MYEPWVVGAAILVSNDRVKQVLMKNALAAVKHSFKKSPLMCGLTMLSIVLPFTTSSRYYQDIWVLTLLWAGMACAWNLYSGYSKRVSLGHGAFMGIGAYTSVLLYTNIGVSPWISMLAGGVLSAIAALIVGGVTIRLRGTFFVLSTIAFAKILEVAAISLKELTGGSRGLSVHYSPSAFNMIFESKQAYAVICWVYLLICLGICILIERSRFGVLLTASGENQEAAESLGVNASGVMLAAFTVSAALTAFGGSIYAQYLLFIEPGAFMGMSVSVNFILLSIAGGMGTAYGPVLGALLLMPLSILLRGGLASVSGLHGFVLGMVLLLILIFKPEGILPQLRALTVELRIWKTREKLS